MFSKRGPSAVSEDAPCRGRALGDPLPPVEVGAPQGGASAAFLLLLCWGSSLIRRNVRIQFSIFKAHDSKEQKHFEFTEIILILSYIQP